ncbi:MAG: transglutaminase domain-containing protein [Ruminiclostridium sp.]
MKTNRARFPAGKSPSGRRAALIFASVIIAAMFAVFICGAEGSAPTSRKNLLLTSHNESYYAVIETNGDKISVRGKYAEDGIRKIYLSSTELSGYSINVGKDGSFEAELTAKKGVFSDSSDNIVFSFNSGASFNFLVQYDGGWYFPYNGLSETNREIFDNIYDAPPEAAALYLTTDPTPEKVAATQEQLRTLSDKITEGIENDYEKARAIAEYVAETIYYDFDARNSSVTDETVALSNVLKLSRTVCSGFANLYCALMQAQGIDCVAVKGSVIGGDVTFETLSTGRENHEWTAFWYGEENRWVWVDSCWNGTGSYKNGEYIKKTSHEKYFDVSDDALALNHRADYAQRRSFFEAKSEIAPETSAPENEPTGYITSQQTTAGETTTAPKETTAVLTEAVKNTGERELSEPLLIGIITVLLAGIAVTAAIIIKANRRK